MKTILLAVLFSLISTSAFAQYGREKTQYRGNLNNDRHDPDSVSNPYGQYGSKYSPDSINNPYGAGNPYGGNKLKVYDEDGKFKGNLNNNKYDPDSVSNPYCQYGSKYSPDSVNNPYGAGSPYGKKLKVYSEDD